MTRYHAGTLNMDVKKVLLDHLVENNMDYTQDVDWKELAKLPKFAGSTPTYLQSQLSIHEGCHSGDVSRSEPSGADHRGHTELVQY